ncbi:Crp/Fnr family transcriptional regulator [Nocardia aurantia]|uniref:CRP-like cAMP-activated global transcriptional regulator n=1 Tax=Nocardia aurantia TaxID=2585199 RepID=A0A7K0DYE5_9NOCA|nr:Crp/Fnr family transcriptional regulator [Nocardia aurantia]MQY30830.1 CRP-like cAMP-activated global transcriptional regulator [Nocardia aurantia]
MTTEFALLRSLEPEERRQVLASCIPRRFKRREILCHEGDPGDTLHLVRSGLLLIRVATPLGYTATLTMIGPGDSFGELALLSDDARRTATVEAAENAETLTLSRAQLAVLREAHPTIDRMITATLVEQVRRLSANVLEALYLPVEARVVRRLANLARIYGGPAPIVEIRLTQDDLASMAGTTRVTANRVLRDLEQRGILALRRGRIIVTDRAGLAAAANATP